MPSNYFHLPMHDRVSPANDILREMKIASLLMNAVASSRSSMALGVAPPVKLHLRRQHGLRATAGNRRCNRYKRGGKSRHIWRAATISIYVLSCNRSSRPSTNGYVLKERNGREPMIWLPPSLLPPFAAKHPSGAIR